MPPLRPCTASAGPAAMWNRTAQARNSCLPTMMRMGFGLKGSSKKSLPLGDSPERLIQLRLEGKKPKAFLRPPVAASLSPNAELAKQDVAIG